MERFPAWFLLLIIFLPFGIVIAAGVLWIVEKIQEIRSK